MRPARGSGCFLLTPARPPRLPVHHRSESLSQSVLIANNLATH